MSAVDKPYRFLKSLPGAHASRVELIEHQGKQCVLKTCKRAAVVQSEKYFFERLKALGLPTLDVYEFSWLQPNQLALEYVAGSPTLQTQLSPNNLKEFGRQVRKVHSVTREKCTKLDDSGSPQVVAWQGFIAEEVRYAEERQAQKENRLSAAQMTAIKNLLQGLSVRSFTPALLHLDLHTENALIKDGDLMLFDKHAGMLYGDPLFDLATVFIVMPGRYTGESTDDLGSFIEGYGQLPEGSGSLLDAYVLLRSFRRFPNPAEPQLTKIIDTILSRQPTL